MVWRVTISIASIGFDPTHDYTSDGPPFDTSIPPKGDRRAVFPESGSDGARQKRKTRQSERKRDRKESESGRQKKERERKKI